ncbi:hypothetical protein PV326_010248 [Microctonus aethiopoides]|nr:hypothetical protein PV326_010248 [Microctonus aethiopoides]
MVEKVSWWKRCHGGKESGWKKESWWRRCHGGTGVMVERGQWWRGEGVTGGEVNGGEDDGGEERCNGGDGRSIRLNAAAGGSDDWMMGVAGADLSYTMELPGGRFDPPPSRIASVGIETFEAFKIFQQFVEEKYVKKSLLN